MIKTMTVSADGSVRTEDRPGDPMQLCRELQPGALLWIFIDDPRDSDDEELSRLGVHDLARQDASRKRHPAKYESFSAHHFLLLKDLVEASESLDSETCQCAIFVFEQMIITRCNGPSSAFQSTWRSVEANPGLADGGAMTLALRLMRAVADRYLQLMVRFEDQIEAVEDAMTMAPTDGLLTDLSRYRANLKRLRRIFAYHQQAATDLRKEIGEGRHVHRVTDVCEQFARVSSLAQLHHDIMTELADGFMALSSHRLNGIMKVLTIVTVIFVPLSFLAGIYGMNFAYIPELSWRYAYFTLLGVMACIVVSLVVFFRWRRWL